MRRRTPAVLVTVAAAVAAVIPGIAFASAGTPGPAATARPGAIAWGRCPEDVVPPGIPLPKDMQCATIKVPLDHRQPRGKTIELAISRLPSTAPQRPHGVLLTNPGGPSPGLGYPAELVAFGLPRSVRENYDVIGFDPRGIGRSTPFTCDLTPEQQSYGNIPPYARTPADVVTRAAESRQVARQCATSSTARMLPYLSTANAARDMDRIRAALGRPKISYLGYSWGTHLGAVYATLFPDRGDRVVLDSSLGPGGWDYPSDRLWSQGFEDRFPDFAKFAAARDGEYHLGGTPVQVAAKYTELAARLDRTPVQTPEGPYDGRTFRLLTWGSFYGDAQFPALAASWQALDAGRAPEQPGGGGGLGDVERLISGRYGIICNDSRWPKSVATYQRAVAVDRLRHPMYGAAGANIQPCAFWPEPVEAPTRIGGRGPSNVLMVQNLRDPATPLAGARQLRRAFGARARMVTVDHGGHGVYLLAKNACADDAVTTFLITGKRPARDSACAAQR